MHARAATECVIDERRKIPSISISIVVVVSVVVVVVVPGGTFFFFF